MGKWFRMVDSAQRQVVLENPTSEDSPDLTRLTFEIQGIIADFNGNIQSYAFADMVDLGVNLRGMKPHGVWSRLLRRPAPVGEVFHHGEHRIHLRFFTQPHIDCVFDLAQEDDAVLWRESEIMVMSGGFHYKFDDVLKEAFKNP